MENINIITDSTFQKLSDDLFRKSYEKAQSEKSYDPYLSPKQLSELFPYRARFFRDRISRGEIKGKICRNGDCMAKYKEVEKYLFDSK